MNQPVCCTFSSLPKTDQNVQLFPTRAMYPAFLKYIGICLIGLIFSGCATTPEGLKISGMNKAFPPETIIKTANRQAVSFDAMMADLYETKIIYVGEQHNQTRHHEIQLRILEQLSALYPDLTVGMEMFAHPYQPVLAKWPQNKLSRKQFLEKTHWYANWKFDFALYQDILLFLKEHQISLFGLNVPFHIPPKIAVGGIDNLLPDEKALLPADIDLSNLKHREFVKAIFEQHHQPGLTNFEYFYAAQCVWEDAMAETIAQNVNNQPMLVFTGTGHLRHHYGIPIRTHKRKPISYRTIIPMPAGQSVDSTIADYIWVTPPQTNPNPRMP